MAKSSEDIESYLHRLSRPYERVDDGTFLVSAGANQAPIAIRIADPVVVIQAEIGAAPTGDTELEAKVFRRLLELNGTELVHVSYALENGNMTLGAALELENLDLNELEAVLAGVDLALAQHVPALRDLVKKKG